MSYQKNNKMIKTISEMLERKPRFEEIEIAKIQNILNEIGYQWRETVFSDGDPRNCYLQVCISSKKPSVFSQGKDDAGWGRFERVKCWQYALEWAKSHERKAD